MIDRRDFLAGLAAFGASALRGQTPASGPRLIDCHHHFVSPAFLKALTAKVGKKVPGYTDFFPLQLWQNYSPAKDVEAMDRDGVEKSMLSITSPGVTFGDPAESRALAREMNEYGAKMATDYKGRFGLFAVLPLPSVDDSLKEIEYAFDTLKCAGVGLLTSYGNHWLGDPSFQPVFDELNKRKAVVYTHPIDAPCCQDLVPGANPTVLEYPNDTARTILSLLTTKMAERYADIKFIFSHAGGTMPGVFSRFGVGQPDTANDILRKPAEPGSRLFQLRRFYYDTAQSTNFVQMQALKGIVGASQILFGTDLPFGANAARQLKGLQGSGFTEEELRGIQRENIAKIL